MSYPLNDAKKEITTLLEKALLQLKLKCEAKLELPPGDMGDFAFPCFPLAKIAKKSPNAIAEDISKKINESKWVEKVEVKGAYVNFYLDKNSLKVSTIKSISEKKEKYGNLETKKEKVQQLGLSQILKWLWFS